MKSFTRKWEDIELQVDGEEAVEFGRQVYEELYPHAKWEHADQDAFAKAVTETVLGAMASFMEDLVTTEEGIHMLANLEDVVARRAQEQERILGAAQTKLHAIRTLVRDSKRKKK